MTEAYLNRIGAGYEKPSLDYLFELQKKHVSRIPFENIDIVCDVKLSLETDNLKRKILDNKFGGFCYELNWLFYQLLIDLGFNVSLMKGQVYSARGIPGPEFDHLCLKVDIENEAWLVDVGYGKGFIHPLKINHGYIFSDDKTDFQVASIGKDRFEIRRVVGNKLDSMYFFDVENQSIESFYEQFDFKQCSAQSPFRKKLVCARYDRSFTPMSPFIVLIRGFMNGVSYCAF